MKVNDLFFELSHEGRYKVLKSISKKRSKHMHLEKELRLTGPEISRHLKRLQEAKLIQKTVQGDYQITSFGKLICSVTVFFENSLSLVDFINTHNFENIPLEILFQIICLSDIELGTKTMENIELWAELIKKSNRYIYAITDQLQTSVIPIAHKKVQSGTSFDIKAIIDRKLFEKFTKSEYLTPKANELLKQIDFFNSVRLSEELDLSLIITDNGAIIFLRAGDSIDYSKCIFSKSEDFLKLTKKIFDLYWHKAIIIKPSNLPLKL